MKTLALILFVCAGLAAPCPGAPARDFLRGADISFLPQVEGGGGQFLLDGEPADLFAILDRHGLNTIRLRLWHSPGDLPGSLATTLALADRAQAAGFEILLDFHFSDTWADPAHQAKPAAWAHLAFTALKDSLRAYTRNVLTAFDARGLAPSMVQLGNEITSGLLWPEGRVGGKDDTPAHWSHLADLLRSAVAGIDDALPRERRPEILIHLDRSTDNNGARWFLDRLQAQNVEFDLIGLSYYPWWHGSLAELEANLTDLARRYDLDLVVVETAYPWTLGWHDEVHNLVGQTRQLLKDYPATPEGQHAFLTAVMGILHDLPDGRGRGLCWWAPTWISTPGVGSAGENLTLFDERGAPLPALEAFAPCPLR